MLDSDKMGSNRNSSKLMWIGVLPILIVTVLVSGMLIFSDTEPSSSFWSRGDKFWIRLAWTEVIISCSWVFGVILPLLGLTQYRQQIGGGFLVESAVVFKAGIYSLVLLFASLWIPDERLYSSIHYIIQILLVVWVYFVLAASKQAQSLQNDGLETLPDNTMSPIQISNLLKNIAKTESLDSEATSILMNTINLFEFSIPRQGNVTKSKLYRLICDEVNRINMDRNNALNLKSDISQLHDSVNQLIQELKN